MTNGTEQKIIDAALKIFAEKGYAGATTRIIAQEANINELTLFRKFKTKENLFYMVITQKVLKMVEDGGYVLMNLDNKFENSPDFLKSLIRDITRTAEDHFEVISLMTKEREMILNISENFIEGFANSFSEYMERNIQNNEIDSKVLVFSILSFIYLLLLDQGRTFVDREEAIEKFINILNI